jgi:hypothetical protein
MKRTVAELTEEIERIERALPHLRDLGDVANQTAELARLRVQREALTARAVAA